MLKADDGHRAQGRGAECASSRPRIFKGIEVCVTRAALACAASRAGSPHDGEANAVQFFGLEITGDHARLIVPVLGGAIAVGGFIAGRWSKHRGRVHFKREDLVTSLITVENYGIKTQPDGSDMLHIVTQGSSSTLESFFLNADLVRHVKREAVKHPGLLLLPNPVAHRMMMDEGKDKITGLEPKANMDFLHGRPTQDDETLFGFAAYSERDRGGNGLHDQIARLVLMVVSPILIERLADSEYVERLGVAHSGYRPRAQRLHDFAREWQRLQILPIAERSSATDRIWQITVRTSLR